MRSQRSTPTAMHVHSMRGRRGTVCWCMQEVVVDSLWRAALVVPPRATLRYVAFNTLCIQSVSCKLHSIMHSMLHSTELSDLVGD